MRKLRILAALALSCILVSCSNDILGETDGTSESRRAENVRTVTFYCRNAEGSSPETIITKTISGSQSTLQTLPKDPTKPGFVFAGWWTKANGEGTSFLADTVVSADIAVYAKWSTRPVYRVSFMTYGGTPVSVRKVTENGKLDSPGNPTKQGYLFGGWFREESCSTPWNFSTDTVASDVTLHAKWDTYGWKVALIDTDADAQTVLEVVSPAWTVGELPQPTSRGNLHFGGWWTAQDGKGTQFTATTPVYSDIALYSWWTTKPVFTLTFDAQGGSPVGSRTAAAGTFPAEPEATARDGYSFGGWYSEPNGKGSPFSLTKSVASDATWYAYWKAYSFTVTFDSDGATVPAEPETVTVKSPAYAVGSLPAKSPEKTGYLFSGWYTERNGDGIQFTESTKVTRDLRVYAAWKEYEYRVTFDEATGTDSARATTMTVASPQTALASLPGDPIREGYVFDGWYSERDGKGRRFFVGTEVSSDIRLYAHWARACVISFNANGGAGSMGDLRVRLGEATALPRNSYVRTGFTFAGWALSSYGTRAHDDGSSVTPTSPSLALYATWKINSYSVSFEPNGGTGKMSPISMEYNKVTTLSPVRFSREGFSFAGWSTGANDAVILPNLGIYTMGAANVRLFAVWKYASSTNDRAFVWKTADGKATITGLSAEWDADRGTALVLPNVVSGYPVASVSRGAFADAAGLTSIDTSPDNAFFRSKDGVLFTADMTTLLAYPAAKKTARYAVPETVVAVAPEAFKNAKNLASVSFGPSLRSVGERAFAGCAALTLVSVAADEPPELGSDAFAAGTRLTLDVPDRLAAAYCAARGWDALMSDAE